MNHSHSMETLDEMFESESIDSMDLEYTVVDNNVIIDKKLFTHLTTMSRQVHELKTAIIVMQTHQESMQRAMTVMVETVTDLSNRVVMKTIQRPSWLGH